MTTTSTLDLPGVSGETYQRIQHFYATHMQLLDDGAADEWAEGFTEDAVFGQNVKEQPWQGRETIAAHLRAGLAAQSDQRVTRRHWFGMITARPGETAGTYLTRYYALVIETPHTDPPSGAAMRWSIVGEDTLVEKDNSFLIKHRIIAHDGVD